MKRLFAIAVLFAVLVVPDGLASERTLPFANFAGYTTTLTVVNPTNEPVSLAGLYRLGSPGQELGPLGVLRLKDWPRAGGGVEVLSVDSGLWLYAEIRDPHGVIVRVEDLGESVTYARFFDVIATYDFSTFIFLHSEKASTVTVNSFSGADRIASDAYSLAPGEAILPRVPYGANRVEVEVGLRFGGVYPVAPIRALALISRQPRGELLLVRSR